MESRQVVDEVVDAHVESEVAYLEVYPTQVKGLVGCHRVGGWMVMCQWVGVWKVTGQCVWIRNVVWKVTGQCVGALNVVWKVTSQCMGVRNVVWMVRGKYERVTK